MGAPPVPAAQAVIQQPISTSEFRIPFSISQVALLRSRDLIRFGTSVVLLTGLDLSASRPRLPLLNPAGGAVAGDLRCFNAPPTRLLPPRDVGAREAVRAGTWEIAARFRAGRTPESHRARPLLSVRTEAQLSAFA
jgi:hypothetical protein